MAPLTSLFLTVGRAKVPVRLTLAALAEIETALGTDSLGELARRLADPAPGDLEAALRALVRAGGQGAITPTLSLDDLDPDEAMGLVARLLGAAIGGPLPGKAAAAERRWGVWLAFWTGRHGGTPKAFWELDLDAFGLICAAARRLEERPLERGTLTDLIARTEGGVAHG